MKNQIDDQSWKQLYDQAILVKKAKPWLWMNQGQIFAIEDPGTKINYYCSFNSMNTFDSLQIFIGEEGINRHLCSGVDPEVEATYSARGQVTLDGFMAPFDEYSYQCNFCNLIDVEKFEQQRIKRLGYSFRGAKQWVVFQACAPGEIPRDLQRPEEVALLTLILGQANVIASAEQSKKLVEDILDDTLPIKDFFIWRYDQAHSQWGYDFLSMMDVIEKVPVFEYPNQLFVRKVRKLKYNKKIYEMLRIYIPKAIKEGEDIYFPVMFMLMDLEIGVIAWDHLDRMYDSKLGERLIDNLATFFIHQGSKPAEIISADMVVQELISNFCADTKIRNELLEETMVGNDLVNDFLEFHFKMDESVPEPDDFDQDKLLKLLTEDLGTNLDESIVELIQAIVQNPPKPSPVNRDNLIDISTRRPKNNEPK